MRKKKSVEAADRGWMLGRSPNPWGSLMAFGHQQQICVGDIMSPIFWVMLNLGIYQPLTERGIDAPQHQKRSGMSQ